MMDWISIDPVLDALQEKRVTIRHLDRERITIERKIDRLNERLMAVDVELGKLKSTIESEFKLLARG